MDFKSQLLTFVNEEILDGIDCIDAEENLLSDGVVDSLGMLRLVGFIELSFDVKIAPEQFIIENFRTIDTISRFLSTLVESKDNAS